ncbi:peptidoglycan-binding protein [Candidatus Kaiserbacteria bacterium]|nr:peptidoglycan-binding protein [Candidatus Kaiserbacteria bacterium]
MRKKLLYVLFGALAFAPLISSAQTFDLQAEIQTLLQQVAALQGELQKAVATTPASTPPPSTTSGQVTPVPTLAATPAVSSTCLSFSRMLSMGSQGSDVTALQRYLASDPSLYPSGSVTGYFGALTEQAVKRFQVKFGIVSSGSPATTGYGAVGPKTRLTLSQKSCGLLPEIESGGTVPRCAINVNRKTVLAGEPVTVSWNSANATYAVDNTNGMRVSLRGSTTFYPTVTSTYTFSFFGATVSLPAVCSVKVTVGATDSTPANPPPSTNSEQAAPTPSIPVSVNDTLVAAPSSGAAPLDVRFSFKAKVGYTCTSRALSIEYGDGNVEQLETSSCASAGVRSASHLYAKTGAYTARVYDNSPCENNTRCDKSTEVAKTLVAVSGLSACTAGGVTLPSGVARDFYNTATAAFADDTCDKHKLSRTCTDGLLSGDRNYSYGRCREWASLTCNLDGVTVANDASRMFYSKSSVPSGSSCTSVGKLRTCEDGELSGSSSYNKANCAIAAPTCTLDKIELSHGSSTTFYFAQYVPTGELCSSYAQTRSCTSGVLSGSSAYQYSTCTPVSAGYCALDNTSLASGFGMTFYKYRTAPAGELCDSHKITRTCTNGTLSGDSAYLYASCANQTTCTLDGITLGHSSSSVFYKARTVPFGSTCASASLSRTCTNGKLSGDDTYQYVSCSVNAPVASLRQNLANAFLASAQTASEIQARIQVLLKELAALQAQLLSASVSDANLSQQSTGPTFRVGAACPVISRDLRLGMRGEDVAALQRFLIAQGLLGAENATGYYGALTRQAVQALQSGLGVVSSGSDTSTGWGILGPKTRAALARGCALMKTQYNTSPTPAATPPQTAPSSTASPTPQKSASPPTPPPSPPSVVPPSAVEAPAVTSTTPPAPSITLSSPSAGAAFVVGDAVPVSWKTTGIPSGAALYLQLINSSNGSIVRSQKAGGSSASFSTSGACNGNFSDAPDADCAGLRSMIAKNLIFHFIQAIVYTPANGCLGFCAPGTPAATTLLTAKSEVFTLKTATFAASPTSGSADLEVTFSGSVPAGYFGGAEIDFGDASDNTSVCKPGFACTYQVRHTYTSSGTYSAKLKGVGEVGFSALGEQKITVASPASASPCVPGRDNAAGGQVGSSC